MKANFWICDCKSPLPDLNSKEEYKCMVCGMDKPISLDTKRKTMKKEMTVKEMASLGGKAKYKKYGSIKAQADCKKAALKRWEKNRNLKELEEYKRNEGI
jgi:hypothetical protein